MVLGREGGGAYVPSAVVSGTHTHAVSVRSGIANDVLGIVSAVVCTKLDLITFQIKPN